MFDILKALNRERGVSKLVIFKIIKLISEAAETFKHLVQKIATEALRSGSERPSAKCVACGQKALGARLVTAHAICAHAISSGSW